MTKKKAEKHSNGAHDGRLCMSAVIIQTEREEYFNKRLTEALVFSEHDQCRAAALTLQL